MIGMCFALFAHSLDDLCIVDTVYYCGSLERVPCDSTNMHYLMVEGIEEQKRQNKCWLYRTVSMSFFVMNRHFKAHSKLPVVQTSYVITFCRIQQCNPRSIYESQCQLRGTYGCYLLSEKQTTMNGAHLMQYIKPRALALKNKLGAAISYTAGHSKWSSTGFCYSPCLRRIFSPIWLIPFNQKSVGSYTSYRIGIVRSIPGFSAVRQMTIQLVQVIKLYHAIVNTFNHQVKCYSKFHCIESVIESDQLSSKSITLLEDIENLPRGRLPNEKLKSK